MPHLDPAVQMELRTLFMAGRPGGHRRIKFLSVSEVYDAVLDARPAAPRDLVREFQLDKGSAMEALGSDG